MERATRRIALLVAFVALGGCYEQTLVGPEAQEAFEQTRDRYESDRQDQAFEYNRALMFLDGEEVSYDELRDLDPKRIDRIEVFKGEKAMQEYGDRGANGVILIFLKDAR